MNITDEQRRQRIEEYLEDIPVSCQATYLKAINGKSLRAAASCQCFICMVWQRSAVKYCDNVTCPLWPYRPVDGITKGRKNRRKIAAGNFQTKRQESGGTFGTGKTTTGQFEAEGVKNEGKSRAAS
jgi:hypothetical protein